MKSPKPIILKAPKPIILKAINKSGAHVSLHQCHECGEPYNYALENWSPLRCDKCYTAYIKRITSRQSKGVDSDPLVVVTCINLDCGAEMTVRKSQARKARRCNHCEEKWGREYDKAIRMGLKRCNNCSKAIAPTNTTGLCKACSR